MCIHFCLLGPGKSGSTWLYSALSQHSEFCTPRIKETEFFYKESNRTQEKYYKFFAFRPEHKAFGDFSNQNYLEENIVENVLSVFPDTKFIYLYREPYERLLSAYKFDKTTSRVTNVDAFLEQWPRDRLDDYYLIRSFKNKIPRDNLLVINFIDIKESPSSVYASICEFLNLSLENLPISIDKNQSRQPRSRLLSFFGRKSVWLFRRLKLYSVLQILKSSSKVQNIFYKNIKYELSVRENEKIQSHVQSMKLKLNKMHRFKT